MNIGSITINAWIMWIILAAIFLVGEVFTAGFFLLWFGVGALVAAALAALKLGAGFQWAAFVLVTAILIPFSKKFSEKVTVNAPQGVGIDRVIGKEGVVIEVIDPLQNKGMVRVGNEEWRAETKSGGKIELNKKVKVLKVEGTHLLVEEIG